MNEFTENECLPNLEIFRKFEETTHAKVRVNALSLTLKGFPLFARWSGSQNRKRLVLLRRL